MLSKYIEPGGGICHCINRYVHDVLETPTMLVRLLEAKRLKKLMHQAAEELGYHTGDVVYPIASADDGISHEDAFYECDLWDITTAYGRRRTAVLLRLEELARGC